MFQVRTIIVETGWQMIWEVGVMNRETRRGGAGNGCEKVVVTGNAVDLNMS